MKKILELLKIKIDLNSTNRRFHLVFFIVIVAFFFLNFFQPFGLYYDSTISKEDVFLELFIAMMVAFFVLLFSQFILRNFFKLAYFSVLSLTGWFLLEALLVASAWTFLELFIKPLTNSVMYIWLENLLAYCLIMFTPYFLFVVFIYFKDSIAASQKQVISSTKQEPQNISFTDDSGTVKLVIEVSGFFYIQSADNYVEIFHIENNKLTKSLLRNTIKTLEPALKDSPVIRCHRSYMINTNKIESARKTPSGFDVKLQHIPDIIIPVSRSYVSELQKYL